jgi:hypothetical protein
MKCSIREREARMGRGVWRGVRSMSHEAIERVGRFGVRVSKSVQKGLGTHRSGL